MGAIEKRIALADRCKAEAWLLIYEGLHKQKYNEGFSAHKKETDKILRDMLNKYKSKLSEAQTPKLTKVLNKEKVSALEAKISVIKEIQSKLCQ